MVYVYVAIVMIISIIAGIIISYFQGKRQAKNEQLLDRMQAQHDAKKNYQKIKKMSIENKKKKASSLWPD